jgi:hypothetical protein
MICRVVGYKEAIIGHDAVLGIISGKCIRIYSDFRVFIDENQKTCANWSASFPRCNIEVRVTYCTSNDEKPLFLALNPLSDLASALCECISVRGRLSNAVEFEDWSYPPKGARRPRDAVMNFDVCIFRVDTSV